MLGRLLVDPLTYVHAQKNRRRRFLWMIEVGGFALKDGRSAEAAMLLGPVCTEDS